MVLRRGHEPGGLAVAEREAGGLGARHVGFDDAGVARGAEGFGGHDLIDGVDGFLGGGGEEDPLAGGEAGGFDHLAVGGGE